jgi:protein-tyrosine phosphatase
MKLDANAILPRLWQGRRPPMGDRLRIHGFQALVLCAAEHQPDAHLFPGVEVIYAPNDDNFGQITREQIEGALAAARQTATLVRSGRKVIVTCWAGINRSGLVSAIALHLLTGWSGVACIRHVKGARPGALRNPAFQEVLCRLNRRDGSAPSSVIA